MVPWHTHASAREPHPCGVLPSNDKVSSFTSGGDHDPNALVYVRLVRVERAALQTAFHTSFTAAAATTAVAAAAAASTAAVALTMEVAHPHSPRTPEQSG